MSQPAFKPGDVLGHYRLSEKIGKGGQGEVWRACDLSFDRDVAVKILPPNVLTDESARRRFHKEARAVGKLNHPNIATAHDFGDQPVEYLVTEYVAGSGLDDQLVGGALPEEKVLELGIQLASGLEAAHREGIIHRDLKPGNLRINQSGQLKILDFGLAEMFDPSGDLASMETVTLNMTLTGTLPYMAPEQFAGVSDQRSDLWSVGAVLYEMATGKLLFPEAKLHEVRDAILNSRPRPPREVNPAVSEGLEQVILHCLHKRPEKRYQSATALREDLERLAKGHRTKAAWERQGRRFAVIALVAAVVISAAAGAFFWPQLREKLWPAREQASTDFRLLAILPVQSAGQTTPDDALVRGMAETVSARIAQGTNKQNLQVIPPSELIARDARTTDAARREFGVERVLEVAVQRSGLQVRVTCSLIDSSTHRVVNACTVTGNDNDLFGLQDKLAGEVIAMLPQPARSEQTELAVVHASSPPGYEAYLKGRGYLLDYQKPENIAAAIEQFEAALKVNPNYAPAYAGLGAAYWQRYKADYSKEWLGKATINCGKALDADPKLAEGHLCLGNVSRTRGEYDKALQEIKQAVAVDPNNVLAVMALGDTYDKLDKPVEAEATFKQAIALSPKYWAVYNWAGYFYYGRARYADAEAMFRQASDLAPGNDKVQDNLGDIYLFEGRYQDAIKILQNSVALHPTMQTCSDLGAAYFYLNRYPEAITAFEKAQTLDDKDFLNWGNLGDALYWSPNRRSEATSAYKRAIALARERIEVNPKDFNARAYVAEYSAMLGDKFTADAQIQKALELAPNDPEVMFRAALVYNRFGDRNQALNWLNKSVAAGYSRYTIRDTPDFAPLLSDQQFKSIISGS